MYYKAPIRTHRDLRSIVEGLPKEHQGKLERISAFSAEHLSGVSRRSGETYADHCHEVARLLREIHASPSLIGVALLHDLPVHPDGSALMHEAPVSDDDRQLIIGMHTLRRLKLDEFTKDIDTALKAFASDPRLFPLRMAHRLNDVRNMPRFAPALQKCIGHETLHMYSAIAGRLGMHSWRHEMEDACFRLLRPDAAQALQQQFDIHAANDARCLRHIRDFLLEKMKQAGIKADISYRTKSLYSTYQKMIVKERRFEELTDRLAVRIIVGTTEECYRTLGIVHTTFHPIPGKLKDYIGAPKENDYRSIHTVVFPLPGVTEYPVEIQIRSKAMHEDCEYGSARHSDYKHALHAFRDKLARVDLVRNLLILRQSAKSPAQFETAMRTYFDEKRIALFDPDNNLYHLPSSVTALDFACHTEGKRCRFLKQLRINGRTAPLESPLHDGDTIECRFGRTRTVSKTWLGACRQRSSKTLIGKFCKA